jgi:sec-independent protein translocase protein TatB
LLTADRQATVMSQVFGISFTELVLILTVALVVLGPQRLPGMLRSIGTWIHKLRQMTTEVRAQTGIDDLLRQEGFSGGLSEVRSLLRGDTGSLLRHAPVSDSVPATADPYRDQSSLDVDTTRERPVEGPDAYGALPDDLVNEEAPVHPAPERPVSAQTPSGDVQAESSQHADTDGRISQLPVTDTTSRSPEGET